MDDSSTPKVACAGLLVKEFDRLVGDRDWALQTGFGTHCGTGSDSTRSNQRKVILRPTEANPVANG